MALTLEELKKRWVREPLPLLEERPYSGRKERREEDVAKLAELARLLFERRFERRGRKLVMKFYSGSSGERAAQGPFEKSFLASPTLSQNFLASSSNSRKSLFTSSSSP